MSDKRRVVKDLDDLKAIIASQENTPEFYIMLAGGLARSSKLIDHNADDGSWWVLNEIDDTEQDFVDDKDLLDPRKSHIGEALEKNALVWYGY